jgi:hypothetical protein
MDKLVTYRAYIHQLLDEDQQITASYGDIQREVVIDASHDHYQLLSIGWHKQQRIHSCIWHVDIHDGKIWIQHDGTEAGIANRLVERGVPKSDIVLAFQSPFKRQFSEFAVG